MKFLPLKDFDIVASALNFDTPDCHVTGGIDLYTTKAAGSDKKLYKDIDKSLESQHAALLKLGASLSPPQREELAASSNLSRSSPFGNLAEISSRRTFAYLIATLNASHPDYDFSHVLRPADFRRERDLRMVMNTIDSTLSNVRPGSLVLDSTLGPPTSTSVGSASSASTSPLWGPQMWALVNKEMHLQDCTVFSYQPAETIFDEEDGAIWAMHYFFFSKALKRVAYLYVRGVPLMAHSPQLVPRNHRRVSQYAIGKSIAIGGGRRFGQRRGSRSSRRPSGALIGSLGSLGKNDSRITEDKIRAQLLSSSTPSRPALAISTDTDNNEDDDSGSKRARYWLGDQADQLVALDEDDGDEDDEDMQDVLLWSRDDDSDTDQYFDNDDALVDDDDDIVDLSMDEDDEVEDEKDKKDADCQWKHAVRTISEDIAARMDL